MRFHAKAWLAWAAASACVTLLVDQPFASATAVAALAVVAVAGARRSPEGRSFGVMLKVGFAFIGLRVVLFGLTGHTGDTTLFTLPEIALPGVLGGFSLGGRVTGEVIAQAVAEGLKIAAFLATFGVFMSVVDPARVLRMLPRRLHEAGLVIGIALTFVPTMLRTASEIRDAQRLRGHRFRGIRSLGPFVVPVVESALERSFDLAASMESRGYGRGHPTRVRAESLDAADKTLVVVSAMIAALAFAVRALPSAGWYPYPDLAWPVLDARVIALSASLVAPLVVALGRAARMSRVERSTEVVADEPVRIAS